MKSLLLATIGFILISFSARGQTAGDYRSLTSGNWNATSSWQTFDGASWVAASSTPTSSNGAITIQNTHTITVTAGVTIDQVAIQLGGILTISSGVTVILGTANGTGDDINVNSGGTLNVNGTINLVSGLSGNNNRLRVNGTVNNNGTFQNSSNSKLLFQAGSSYFHLFDGTAANAMPVALWNLTSTVNITGFGVNGSNVPTSLNQNFGNFIWNCPNQDQVIDLGGAPSIVSGTFQVTDTGLGGFYYNNGTGNTTLNIGGDLIFNGGLVGFIGSGAASTGSLSITGNMTISGGLFQLAENVDVSVTVQGGVTVNGGQIEFSNGTGIADLNVVGNFTFSGGDMTVSAGVGNVNFTGASTKTFTSTLVPSGNVNYSVSSQSTLTVSGSNFIGGGGAFSLSGTLQVGSTDSGGALQTGVSAGNIRMSGTRTYASNSTIVYNGTSGQFIGNGFPSSGVVNLTINNGSGVTLSSNLAIVALSVLTLTSGNIVIGGQTLTINGTVSGSGGIVGGATSNLTIGGTGDFGTLTFSGTNQLNNFTLNRTSSGLVTLGGNLTIVGTFTHTAGILAIGSNTFTVSGAWGPSIPDDLSVTSASTIVVNGSGTVPTDFGFDGGSTTLGTFTINRASMTLPTSSSITITNLNLTSGIFSNGSGVAISTGGTITRSGGSMTSNPTNTTNSYNVVYTSGTITSGPELPSSATALANLSKTGSGTLTLGSAVTVNGVLTLSSGSFNAGSNALTLKGNFVSNAASSLTSSAVTFAGNTTLSGSSTPTFGAVTVSGTLTPSSTLQINGNLTDNGTLNAGSGTVVFGGTTSITGSNTPSFNNVTINSGNTLTAPAGTMNIAGDIVNNGTFNHNNGVVVFNGTTTISGSAVTTDLFGVTVSGTLTAPSGTLNIAGNWSTTGTFIHNGGKVALNGTVASQSITGTATVNDVDVSNPAIVFNNGTLNLTGKLTLTSASAIFDADGATTGTAGSGVLTVKSTSVTQQANTGGRIAALPAPGNFFGNVTVERYVNGTNSWTYFSMPITNGNAGMWKTAFPVTGNFSDPSPVGGNVISSSSASIFYWNAALATPAWASIGSGLSTSNTSLSNTVGFSVFSYTNGAFTISTRGTIGKGTVPYTLGTAGGGMNLISNPYPSPIDWDNVAIPGSVSTTMYITNASGTNPVYSSYVKGGLANNAPYTGWSGEVAMGQSFWVQSNGGTSISLAESSKTSNKNQFLRTSAPNNFLRIALISGSQKDESIIWFQDMATDSIDNSFDAIKLRNGLNPDGKGAGSYVNLSSYNKSADRDFAINGVAPISCNKSVRLKVQDVSTASNKLLFTDLDSFDLNYYIYLIDHYLNKQVLITDSLQYSFATTSDPKSLGAERFELQFSSIAKPSVQVLGTTLTSDANTGNQWLLNGIPIQGATKSQYQVTKSGAYSVQVSNGTCRNTSEDIVLSITGVEGSPNDAIKAYPNPVKDKLTLKLTTGFELINIYDSQGKLVESIESSSSAADGSSLEINMSNYTKGTYVLRVNSKEGDFSIKVIKE